MASSKDESSTTKPNLLPMIRLLTNFFKVGMTNSDGHFVHYSLAGKDFAYDGEKSLFTIGALPANKLEFDVVLEDSSSSRTTRGSPGGSPGDAAGRKRSKRQYATKIPMQAIANTLRGQDSEQYQEAVRVLDIILRQRAAKRGCLTVHQSFFHNEPRNFVDLGGGVLGCRGFHSSFRATQGGLSLNMDVSTTVIVKPGALIDVLLANQNAKEPYQIDWSKRMLKSLRIKVSPSNMEYKITGLSDHHCKEQIFILKQNGVVDKVELTLCSLVSLQRYTRALSNLQRATLVEKSQQKPQERMRALTDALRTSNYKADPLLGSAGISISDQFTQVEGRVLPTPKLMIRDKQDLLPRNGRWNFNQKRWAVVNFSARCDVRKLCMDLQRCGKMKGIVNFLLHLSSFLCILPERKNSDLYGPWKKKNLSDLGIVTQCILGGMNSFLAMELAPVLPQISQVPTIIIGMDVSRGSPGLVDVPSIVAVVSSRQWPLISHYRAAVHSLYKKVSDTEDDGIFRYRDGVSESQFNQVISIELNQIVESWCPKLTVVVAQKNHHTKFFQTNFLENTNDFYMCAHAGPIGTTRPTHYHVLHDEIGFSADDMQELVHSLSYVHQRSTTAISVAAPICYAHLATAEMLQFMKFDEPSKTTSSYVGVTTAGSIPVTPLPKLHKNVRSSMFFC
ncbi:unnamed protein product [Withania somnifera]